MFIVIFMTIAKYGVRFGLLLCVLSVISGIYDAFKAFKNKEKFTKMDFYNKVANSLQIPISKKTYIVIVTLTLALTFITNSASQELLGIHNLEFKPQGTYCFYVEVSNHDNTYTLPAEIYKEEYRKEHGEREQIIINYYVQKVFFTNGGYLDFSKSDSVEIGETYTKYDQDDDEWEIKLLNKHAYSPYVEETNNANWFDITLLSFQVASSAILLIALLGCNEYKKEKHNGQ